MSIDLLPVRSRHTSGFGRGWIPDLPDPRDHLHYSTELELLDLPASVRLDETTSMPDPYDQGQLGSCTGNGIAGAVEFDLRSQGLTDFVPSRLFIYFNERKIEGTVDSDSGAQIRDGIKSIAAAGVCPESEWPYDISKFTVQPSAQCYTDASKVKALNYAKVTAATPNMQAVLAKGKPFVFGITLWQSFEDVGSDGVVPMPNTRQAPIGGHCMLGCGYAVINGKLYIRVRNSWGKGWGDGGYCWIPAPYMSSSLASDRWVVNTVS